MSAILIRAAETLAILYTIVSYTLVVYSLFLSGQEKAKEIPGFAKLFFTVFAPLILLVAFFVPVPKSGQ